MVVDSGGSTVLSAVTAMSSLSLDKAMFCANLSLGTEEGSECKTIQCARMICHSPTHASPAHRITSYHCCELKSSDYCWACLAFVLKGGVLESSVCMTRFNRMMRAGCVIL